MPMLIILLRELARLTADYFWFAGALEGSVCALLVDRMGQREAVLEDEVRHRYNNVILHYRKSFIQDNAQRVSPLSFELEAILKLARFLCRRELAKEVVELLTNAADGVMDGTAYDMFLDRLWKEGKSEEAVRVFDYMRGRNMVSSASFASMIRGLCRVQELRSAMKLHAEMLKMGLKPDKEAYKRLIAGFS